MMEFRRKIEDEISPSWKVGSLKFQVFLAVVLLGTSCLFVCCFILLVSGNFARKPGLILR